MVQISPPAMRRFVLTALLLAALLPATLIACNGTLPVDRADASSPVPLVHRAAGSICPSQRGAGMICSGGPDGGANGCAADSDCASGTNGRCFSPNGPLAACSPTSCSYDQCASDSDCATRVPCECRASGLDSEANLCVTGGNCAVDSDCGTHGYCSPGALTNFCSTPIYFCHTAADSCVDDTDCSRSGAGYPQSCNYDPMLGHFACSDACVPPP